MIHSPIQIKNLNLSFPHKTCFEDFSTQIFYGSRIGIIGTNGSGKSTLLRMLQKLFENHSVAYVPQIIEDYDSLSGSQRLNKALSEALSLHPDVLFLDEPTNHLDQHNRKSLLRMLRAYQGTLIIVSHDVELLRSQIDTLWHIDGGSIHIFTGSYDDYMRKMRSERASVEQKLARLEAQKRDTHDSLMKEQKRASSSKAKGEKSIEQRKWPSVVSAAKARRAQETSGRKRSAISDTKQELLSQLSSIRLPEIIKPKFSIAAAELGERTIISIVDGSLNYADKKVLIAQINLSIGAHCRVAITGDNASGKSTLLKAIMSSYEVEKTGSWILPKPSDIGYLDQHYRTLSLDKTALQNIAELAPHWSMAEARKHLNDFLFRKNEEVNIRAGLLSGGEKARLSLAQIAARTPKLLVLDEMTNNLDLATKEHVVDVLKNYPGALIVVSHDVEFLAHIGINKHILVANGSIKVS